MAIKPIPKPIPKQSPESHGTIQSTVKGKTDTKTQKKKKGKKTRRRKTNEKTLQQMKIYYINIRGIKSKVESLKEIIEEKKPDLIAIVETHLEKGEKMEIEGYHIIRKDRNSEGGGVMMAMKERHKNTYTEIENEDTDDAEKIWIVLGTKTKYKIGVIYAPKGDKARLQEIRTRYKNIEKEIKKGQEEEQKVIVIGDLNCKIGKKIHGGSEETTKGGRVLIEMAEKNEMQIVNSIGKMASGQEVRGRKSQQ